MSYTIKSVEDHGNDMLVVLAEDAEGNEVKAIGSVSATTNHFDADAYQEYTQDDVDNPEIPVGSVGRHLKPDAKPRAMSEAEVGEYAKRLVSEQFPEGGPKAIAFQA